MNDPRHIVIADGGLVCRHCGATWRPEDQSAETWSLLAVARAFLDRHAACRPSTAARIGRAENEGE